MNRKTLKDKLKVYGYPVDVEDHMGGKEYKFGEHTITKNCMLFSGDAYYCFHFRSGYHSERPKCAYTQKELLSIIDDVFKH